MSSNALNKILEVAEANCNEGAYLEIANLLKQLHTKEKPEVKAVEVWRKQSCPEFICIPNATHSIKLMIPRAVVSQKIITHTDTVTDLDGQSYELDYPLHMSDYDIKYDCCRICLPIDTPMMKDIYNRAKTDRKLDNIDLKTLGFFADTDPSGDQTNLWWCNSASTAICGTQTCSTREYPIVEARKMTAAIHDQYSWARHRELIGYKYPIVFRRYRSGEGYVNDY